MLVCACLIAVLPMAPARAESVTGDLRRLSVDVACSATKTDRRFSYRYRYDVTLSVHQGTVRRLKLSQRATSKDGDDQGCHIDLADFKQEAAKGAIVLREADGDGEKPRCTVRITAEAKQIRIKIGDASEAGNDCRGGDNVMYCSPRAFWADMVVDRKSSACRPVE